MENKTQATHPDSDHCGGTHQAAQLPPAPRGTLTRWAEGLWALHGAHRPHQGSWGGGLEWGPSSSPAPDAPCTPPHKGLRQPTCPASRMLSPGEARTAGPGQDAVSSESPGTLAATCLPPPPPGSSLWTPPSPALNPSQHQSLFQ